MSIPNNPGRAPLTPTAERKEDRTMRGVVIALVVVFTAGLMAVAVGTSKTVEVARVEECVKRTGNSYRQVSFLGVSWISSSFALEDGRTVPFGDREWSMDAFGNLCRTVYVPKKQAARPYTETSDRVSGPRGIPILPTRQQDDCRSWDWDFSPREGSIGFRCVDNDER